MSSKFISRRSREEESKYVSLTRFLNLNQRLGKDVEAPIETKVSGLETMKSLLIACREVIYTYTVCICMYVCVCGVYICVYVCVSSKSHSNDTKSNWYC